MASIIKKVKPAENAINTIMYEYDYNNLEQYKELRTDIDVHTGKFIAPSVPMLQAPLSGIEVSNLNPILHIEWEKAADIHYIERGYYSADSGPSGWHNIPPNKWLGLVHAVRYFANRGPQIEGGVTHKIEFYINKPLGPTDVWCELREAIPADGISNFTWSDEPVHAAYLESDGSITIPYEKKRRYKWIVALLKTSRTDLSIGVAQFSDTHTKDNDHAGYSYMVVEENSPTGFYQYSGTMGDMIIYNSNTQTPKTGPVPATLSWIAGGHDRELWYQVDISFDNGGNWQTVLLPTAGITSYDLNLTQFLDAGIETYQAKIRIRARDENSVFYRVYDPRTDNYSYWGEMDGVFTVIKHIPPNAPINLKSSDTGIIDKNIENRLSWKYIQNSMNNRQGRALIQWRKQGETLWNEIAVDGMNTFYDVPASTFPIGTIEWQVKTWNYVDMEGPFSTIQTFEAKDTPAAPTIASPIGTAEVTSPMVVWEHPYIQTHYNVQVLSMSDLVIWETGQVEGNTLNTKITHYLENLTSFKVQVRVKTDEGLWSSWATGIFQTDYKYPAPAEIEVTAKEDYITVSYENGIPTGEQPNTVRNEVYKYIDSEWIKMSDGYTFTFDDYSVPNDVTVYYYIRSYAENGAYTDSDVVSAKVKLTGVVLYLVNNPVSTRKQFKRVIERQNDWSIESVSMRFKGRRRPVKEVGTLEDDVISFSLRLNKDERRALDEIVYSGQIVCYRDGNGRLGYGIFDRYNPVDLPNGETEVSLELEEIDYSEGAPKADDNDGVVNVVIDGGEY